MGQDRVVPLYDSTWATLARYWIGFQLAGAHQQWSFLRANKLPKPDKNIYPEYYGDILQFAKVFDLTAIKSTTKFISLLLGGQSGPKHADAKCWRDAREV